MSAVSYFRLLHIIFWLHYFLHFLCLQSVTSGCYTLFSGYITFSVFSVCIHLLQVATHNLLVTLLSPFFMSAVSYFRLLHIIFWLHYFLHFLCLQSVTSGCYTLFSGYITFSVFSVCIHLLQVATHYLLVTLLSPFSPSAFSFFRLLHKIFWLLYFVHFSGLQSVTSVCYTQFSGYSTFLILFLSVVSYFRLPHTIFWLFCFFHCV